MGQYYKVCNVDKKEYMNPWDFGGFAKLMEFGNPIYPDMITSALVVLLADGNNRGGGDLRSDNPIIGSWKYDRIVVCGDYADANLEFSEEENIYVAATTINGWKNISIEIMSALMDDWYTAQRYGRNLSENYDRVVSSSVICLAHAHKDKQYKNNRWPNVATFAEEFFEKLYPEKDTDYYKTINGIVKHHGGDCTDHLQELEKQLVPGEMQIMMKRVEIAKEEYISLHNQLEEMQKKA